MHVSMYMCMYVCIYVCMYVCMYIYMYVCVFICICMYECIYVCMYVCMYLCMCVCLNMRMYVTYNCTTSHKRATIESNILLHKTDRSELTLHTHRIVINTQALGIQWITTQPITILYCITRERFWL